MFSKIGSVFFVLNL